MPPAPTRPRFARGSAPVSFLVDYDGTISRIDIGDELLARHYGDRRTLAEKDALYDAGRIGSRELVAWDMDVLPRDGAVLRREAAEMPQDEGFAVFVDVVRRHGAALEVVSDGLGFYVESNLARLGLRDIPIATNENRLEGGGTGMSFPYGHPRCQVCGTCKRERVRTHQAAGRIVVFVGDGTSDRFAAAHAEIVFAKHSLARLCRAEGWPFIPWRTFADLTDWTERAFRGGDLPRTSADVGPWRGRHAPAPRPFICGPEVWGPFRRTPGPGPGTTAGARDPLPERADP
jgi:2-hydroxy-3-keto-5-methylthiopentenyl-1-phosphate phosphatase